VIRTAALAAGDGAGATRARIPTPLVGDPVARRLLPLAGMDADRQILRARNLMQRDVIVVTPDTPILDVYRLFVEEEIHGAPVVDEDTDVVQGVISTLDLLRVVREELEPGAGATSSNYFRDELPYSGPDWSRIPDDLQDRVSNLTARDAMSRGVIMVDPDATVGEVASTMLSQRIHRVFVGRQRQLEGVLTTFDLMRVVSEQPEPVVASSVEHTGYAR
jgi:CBS domain-containing protein